MKLFDYLFQLWGAIRFAQIQMAMLPVGSEEEVDIPDITWQDGAKRYRVTKMTVERLQ